MVDELVPSAGTVDKLALIVDKVAEGPAAWNTTVAVAVTGTSSVRSSALTATESETVNVAVPSAAVTDESGETVAVVAGAAVNDTDFPPTGLLPAVSSVT